MTHAAKRFLDEVSQGSWSDSPEPWEATAEHGLSEVDSECIGQYADEHDEDWQAAEDEVLSAVRAKVAEGEYARWTADDRSALRHLVSCPHDRDAIVWFGRLESVPPFSVGSNAGGGAGVVIVGRCLADGKLYRVKRRQRIPVQYGHGYGPMDGPLNPEYDMTRDLPWLPMS